MKASKVMNILGITRPTLSKYVKLGYIKTIILPNGRYDYDAHSVYNFIGKSSTDNRKVISYVRSLNSSFYNSLVQQQEIISTYSNQNKLFIDEKLEDIGSGMSYYRPGFIKLCDEVLRGEVRLIIITTKDRLISLGFNILEKIFKACGTSIIVLGNNCLSSSEMTSELLDINNYISECYKS